MPVISASTVMSLSPRLSTVSIMPRIEARAPERTETSRGLLPSPKVLPPAIRPTAASAVSTSPEPRPAR